METVFIEHLHFVIYQIILWTPTNQHFRRYNGNVK